MKNKKVVAFMLSILVAITIITLIVLQLCQKNALEGKIWIQGYRGFQDSSIFFYNRIINSFKRITPPTMLAFSPSLSPDGKTIAFVSTDLDRTDFHIALVSVQSGVIDFVIDTGIDNLMIQQTTSLAWSPDGGRLLFDLTGNGDCHYLYLYDFKEETLQSINIEFCQSETGHKVYKLDLTWAPSEEPLIGVSYLASYSYLDNIFILDQMLSKPVWIAHGGYPLWRPGTKDISYICWETEASVRPSLCLFSPQQGLLELIVKDYSYDTYAWSPDGYSIIYIETAGESDPVYLSLINLKTGRNYHLRRLIKYNWSDFPYLTFSRWIDGQVIWAPK